MADMKLILEGATAGERAATLALNVYIHRLRAQIAAMAAALGGLDALVFTSGVGENSAEIRSLTVRGLAFLSVELNEAQTKGSRATA